MKFDRWGAKYPIMVADVIDADGTYDTTKLDVQTNKILPNLASRIAEQFSGVDMLIAGPWFKTYQFGDTETSMRFVITKREDVEVHSFMNLYGGWKHVNADGNALIDIS